MNELEINKDSIISDLIKISPKVMEVFFKYGMYCVDCPIATGETIEQAASTHGLEAEELLKEIREKLKEA